MSIAVLARKTKTLQRLKSDKRGFILNMTGRGGGIGLSGLSYKYRGNSSNDKYGCNQGFSQACCDQVPTNNIINGKSQPAPQMCYRNYLNKKSRAAYRPGGKICCNDVSKNNINNIVWKPHPNNSASEITEHRKQATLRCTKAMEVRTRKMIGDTLLSCKIDAPNSVIMKDNKCLITLGVPYKGRLAYTRINHNQCTTTKTVEVNNCASDHTDTVKQRGFLCKCPPDYSKNKKCHGEINTNYCYPKPTATGKYCNLFMKDSNARKKLKCYRSGEKCLMQKV